MNILLLGPKREELINYLLSFNDKVINTEAQINNSFSLDNIDFIISYRYRHIINKKVLSNYKLKVINMHISYLPWNRGADPNLWSFLDETPQGVSIHFINEGIDTGDIIVQRRVYFSIYETLRSSYNKLLVEIEDMFKQIWPDIKKGNVMCYPQPPGWSYHTKKDRTKFEHLLTNGWDTPIANLIGKAKGGNGFFD